MCVTTSSTVWLRAALERGCTFAAAASRDILRLRRGQTQQTSARPDSLRRLRISALVQPRQHELAMAERFGRGEAAVGGAEHALEELVARLVGSISLRRRPETSTSMCSDIVRTVRGLAQA